MKNSKSILETVISLNKNKKFDEVIEILNSRLLDELNNVDLYAEKAKALQGLKQKEARNAIVDIILNIEKNHPVGIYYKGVDNYENKRYEEAIEAYKKAIEVDPEFPFPYNGLGLIYYNQKRYEEAIEAYKKAIEVDPEYSSPYNGLGNTYYFQQRHEEAIEAYKKAIEVDPEYSSPYNGLGNTYYFQQRHEEAIEAYKKAIEVDPEYSSPYNGLGNTYYFQKRHKEAIEAYKKAIEVDPEYSFPYNGLGIVYQNQERYEEAIAIYKKVIEIDPEYASPHGGLGSVYRDQKRYEEAIEAYKKAIEIDPKLSSPYYGLEEIYRNQKRYEEAIGVLRELKKGIGSNSNTINLITDSKIKELEKSKEDLSYSKISEIVSKIKNLLEYEGELITHYTSLSTAKELILNSSHFRISEGTFLNDTSEGKELFRYLNFDQFYNKDDITISYLFSPKPFIGSFVPKGKLNDLTLWRMYGKENNEEAKGCALTISRTKLISNIYEGLGLSNHDNKPITDHEKYRFYRVAYLNNDKKNKFIIPGNSKEEKILNNYMSELKNVLNNMKKDKNFKNENLLNFTELLNEIAFLFKSSAYIYEHEIRLIVNGIGFKKENEYEGLNPKVYIELGDISKHLSSITIGPKVEKPEEWAAVFDYCLKGRNHDLDIHISRLPFK